MSNYYLDNAYQMLAPTVFWDLIQSDGKERSFQLKAPEDISPTEPNAKQRQEVIQCIRDFISDNSANLDELGNTVKPIVNDPTRHHFVVEFVDKVLLVVRNPDKKDGQEKINWESILRKVEKKGLRLEVDCIAAIVAAQIFNRIFS